MPSKKVLTNSLGHPYKLVDDFVPVPKADSSDKDLETGTKLRAASISDFKQDLIARKVVPIDGQVLVAVRLIC